MYCYIAVYQPGAREIDSLAFESFNSCTAWVGPHFAELKKEVDELVEKISLPRVASYTEDDVKERRELEARIKGVVPSKPMHRIRKVRGVFISSASSCIVCVHPERYKPGTTFYRVWARNLPADRFFVMFPVQPNTIAMSCQRVIV